MKEGENLNVKTVGISKQIRIPIEKDSLGNDLTVSKEVFLKTGSVRKPKIVTGDGIKSDVQIVGLISDIKMETEELAQYKRSHWKIENNLHYILDAAFNEDKSPAKKSKNNLAIIRKYAYNILVLYGIQENKEWGIQRVMDYFADHISVPLKYVYEEVTSFY